MPDGLLSVELVARGAPYFAGTDTGEGKNWRAALMVGQPSYASTVIRSLPNLFSSVIAARPLTFGDWRAPRRCRVGSASARKVTMAKRKTLPITPRKRRAVHASQSSIAGQRPSLVAGRQERSQTQRAQTGCLYRKALQQLHLRQFPRPPCEAVEGQGRHDECLGVTARDRGSLEVGSPTSGPQRTAAPAGPTRGRPPACRKSTLISPPATAN